MSEKDLQKQIADLKAEIRRLQKNTLGLNFEDKPEDVVALCKSSIPVLKEVKKNRIKSTKATCGNDNLIIEGENYHALTVLNYTHKNKIDLIYIDPPYNTGHDGFIYNDKFVDTEDSYRHSKWLSFMKKRLELARELLKDSGMIFVSIDDNEQAHLRILCDKVFGDKNFIANIVLKNKAGAGAKPKAFIEVHEYILVYCKDRTKVTSINVPYDENSPSLFTKKDENFDIRGPYGTWALATTSMDDRPNLRYPIIHEGEEIWPEKQWLWSRERVEQAQQNNELVFNKMKNGKWSVRFKRYMKDEDGNVRQSTPTTFFDGPYTHEGTRDLTSVLGGRVFSFPKPVSLIKKLASFTYNGIDNKNQLILDFFAGSGTTGHAVLELNKEDGGNRRFILVTNNGDEKSEHKIATDVCYPRIKKVITGYADKDPIPSNLTYYKTDLVDVENLYKVSDEERIRVTYQVGEMIGVRENTLNEIEKNDWWQIFESENKVTAIYFKEDKSKLNELITKLEKMKKQTALYIFSWGKNENKGEYSSPQIRIEDIPEPILEVYKEINRL